MSLFTANPAIPDGYSCWIQLFQCLGAKYETTLTPLGDFAILVTTKSQEFFYLKEHDWLKRDEISVKYTGAKPFGA